MHFQFSKYIEKKGRNTAKRIDTERKRLVKQKVSIWTLFMWCSNVHPSHPRAQLHPPPRTQTRCPRFFNNFEQCPRFLKNKWKIEGMYQYQQSSMVPLFCMSISTSKENVLDFWFPKFLKFNSQPFRHPIYWRNILFISIGILYHSKL